MKKSSCRPFSRHPGESRGLFRGGTSFPGGGTALPLLEDSGAVVRWAPAFAAGRKQIGAVFYEILATISSPHDFRISVGLSERDAGGRLQAGRFARLSKSKLAAAAAIATGSQIHHRFRFGAASPTCQAKSPRMRQAAGRKRVKLDIGTTLVSRGSPSRSQTSRSAFASPSISRSLWNGVGVIRSRSVPFGTVG